MRGGKSGKDFVFYLLRFWPMAVAPAAPDHPLGDAGSLQERGVPVPN